MSRALADPVLARTLLAGGQPGTAGLGHHITRIVVIVVIIAAVVIAIQMLRRRSRSRAGKES